MEVTVGVPLPILLLISLIPVTHSKSTIEPCNSSDSCVSLLYYILPYDSKLSEIAYRFGVNPFDILGANPISPKTLGDEIFKAESVVKVPIPCSCVDGIRRCMPPTYTVRPADTAASISEGFGGFVSAEQIRSRNGINATNPLTSGQSLVIPLPCTCFGNVSNGIPAVYMSYVVKSGESLSSIASEFGTTAMELEAVNGLGQAVVNSGDVLFIPISACSSANLKWYNESLVVAKGSFALTASNCIKCVCGTEDLNLRCWPSGIAPSCSQLQCKDSDLFIGDSVVNNTPFGCKVTTCIYRGHNGGKIYRSLAYSWQAPCPGNQCYNMASPSPAPSPFILTISPSPSPSPPSNPTAGTIAPNSNTTTKQNFNLSSQGTLLLLTHGAFFYTLLPLGLGLELSFFL
ncbi:LysM domain - like 5 [Theobroma cacao]|nr:LysM domain - like 5 [Theobroma cacao]